MQTHQSHFSRTQPNTLSDKFWCYELWNLLQEQRQKTEQAYKQGKYDAVTTLCTKMYELTDVDPSDFQEDDY